MPDKVKVVRSRDLAVAKFWVGVVVFFTLLGIHFWVREVPYFLWGFPAVLWGVKVENFWTGGKNGK